MWPFTQKNKRRQQATKALAHDAVAAAIGPMSVVKVEPFSLTKHVDTIKSMLEAINLQIENVDRQVSEEATLHENNERQEANRHVIVVERLRGRTAELETLRDTYTAALKIAAPGGADGYGDMTGPTIKQMIDNGTLPALEATAVPNYEMPPAAPTKPAVIKRRRKPARVDQGASAAIDMG